MINILGVDVDIGTADINDNEQLTVGGFSVLKGWSDCSLFLNGFFAEMQYVDWEKQKNPRDRNKSFVWIIDTPFRVGRMSDPDASIAALEKAAVRVLVYLAEHKETGYQITWEATEEPGYQTKWLGGWVYASEDAVTSMCGDCSKDSVEHVASLIRDQISDFEGYVNGEVYLWRLYDKEDGRLLGAKEGYYGARGLERAWKELLAFAGSCKENSSCTQ